jgi:membrane protein insertase Oxa1/YidC/SpoIIIJ
MSAAQRKALALVTALIFGFSLAKYASGLSLYWATGNLVNLLVQLVLNRSHLADQTMLPDSAHQ